MPYLSRDSRSPMSSEIWKNVTMSCGSRGRWWLLLLLLLWEEAEIEEMDFIPQSSIATVDASVTAPPRDLPPYQKTERKRGGLDLEE
jgi:hypothetical protein